MVKNLFYEYFENSLIFEKIVYSRKFPKNVKFSDTKFIRFIRENFLENCLFSETKTKIYFFIPEKLLIFGHEIYSYYS